MILVEEQGRKVVELWSGDQHSWALMPAMLYRIGTFAQRYDSDADTSMMIAHLKMAFVHPKPSAVMLAMLDEKGTLIGHLLVTIESWFGTSFATIVQYEVDKGVRVPRGFQKIALARIEEWAKERGCTFVQALARNATVARAFTTFHGFEENRVVVRKSLSTDVAPSEQSG